MEDKRVYIEPDNIRQGDTVTISYSGLLANNGADQIFLHAGTTVNGQSWNNVNDIQMQPGREGHWTTQLQVNNAEELNLCFKDSANNWDNNNGYNWSYSIS